MRTRTPRLLLASLAAAALSPALAGAAIAAVRVGPAYVDVRPTSDGAAADASAAVVYGGVHESASVSKSGAVASRTCAGVLVAGGCTSTAGTSASGFAQLDAYFVVPFATYTAGGNGVRACGGANVVVCTP